MIVCMDARMIGNSGIGTYIRSLIVRLKNEFDLKLIVNSKCVEEYPFLKDFDLIFAKSKIYSILEQIELPLIIPKCDVFWSPHFNIPLLKIRAKKRLVTIHDVYFLAHKHDLSFLKQLYANFFFSQATKRSDQIITVSEFSKYEILKYLRVPEEKITVVPLGVEKVDISLKEKSSSLFPFKYILFVGNLAPHKNVARLIQSLDFLPEDLHLVIAGRETKHDDWKSEYEKRKDRVHFLGKVSEDDLHRLYFFAEALVHPSLYEGFGLTPIEAMSHGCPVVVSDIASLPEVCGDTAIYIDPLSIKSIADGIKQVLDARFDRQGAILKGLERVDSMNWDVSLKKTYIYFESNNS